MPFKIESLYAYLSVDATGDEGICEFISTRGSRLMIFPDRKTAEMFLPVAHTLARKVGKTITLARFDTRTDLEEIVPK